MINLKLGQKNADKKEKGLNSFMIILGVRNIVLFKASLNHNMMRNGMKDNCVICDAYRTRKITYVSSLFLDIT